MTALQHVHQRGHYNFLFFLSGGKGRPVELKFLRGPLSFGEIRPVFMHGGSFGWVDCSFGGPNRTGNYKDHTGSIVSF